MQFTISVDIPKRNRSVYMLAKTIAVSEMKVPLALLVTHASTLIAGKSLVNGESVYESRDVVRSLFSFITHFFLRFTKKLFEFSRMERPKLGDNLLMTAAWRDFSKKTKTSWI